MGIANRVIFSGKPVLRVIFSIGLLPWELITENYVPSISDKIDCLVKHKVCGHTGKVRIKGIKGDLEIGFDSPPRHPSAGPAVYIHEE